MSKLTPEEFISTIRDSFVGSQQVYTQGSCYHFYLILKKVFPQAELIYDGFHVITKIDGKYYDINGEIDRSFEHNEIEFKPSSSLKTPFNIYIDNNGN